MLNPWFVGFKGVINQDLKNISGPVPSLFRQHTIFIICLPHFTTHLWYIEVTLHQKKQG